MRKPAPATRQIMIGGKVHYSISDTAKMLDVSVHKVRALMGSGQLEYRQIRLNSRQLYVSGESIVRVKYPQS